MLLRISLYTDKVILNFANEMNCWKPSYINCMCGHRLWEKMSLWRTILVGKCSG